MTVPPRWRKASRSSQTASCVEIAHTLEALRDSKNPDGGVLHAHLGDLLAAVKADRLT